MTVRVYTSESLGAYGFPEGHPFGPDRLAAFWNEMLARGLDQRVEIGQPRLCTRDDLLRFHTSTYVQFVEERSISGKGYLDAGDTPAFPGVYEAAATVVGSVLDGLAWLVAGKGRRVFVPIAGLHHARRNGAAGFCVFNDVGCAIEAARAVYGLKRIAYVDIDAHHGDGVFYSYEDDPDLVIADVHEDGRFLYPGSGRETETGRGAAQGTKLNIPLPMDANDEHFHRHWPAVEALVRQAKPSLIILQAGADSILGDPLTHMAFSPAVHRHTAARLSALADEYCEGHLLAMGGGGYDRTNLARAWCGVVEGLLNTSDTSG
ncbi:MAG: acetoin utilization protein AcuC [Pseudomonadota bacterium]